MPRRQTYEVNKRELNRAAQRDQSYRNCLVALLIFFFLCLILILVCVPWKTQSRGGYNIIHDNGKHESQYHHGERTNGPTTTTTTTTKSTVTKEVNDVIIVSSNVSSKKDKGPGTHESYNDGRTQNEVTTFTESTPKADDEDSTEIDPIYNTKEDKVTTTDEDTSVTSPQSANFTEDTTTSSTRKYVTSKIEVVTPDVTTLTSSTPLAQPVVTDMSSSDKYFSTNESEFVMSTDNIATSPDLEEDETIVSTSKYVTSETNVTTYNITSSTLPTRLDNFIGTRKISKADVTMSTMNPSTDSKENTNTGYSSYDHSQKSQSVASIIYSIVKATIPTTTLLDSEKNEHGEYSTEKQEEESITTGYDEILNNNDDITRGSSLGAEDYTPSQSKDFSTTTEIINDSETMTSVTASQNKAAEKYNESVMPVVTKQSSTYDYYTYDSASYTSTTSRTMIASSISDDNMIAMTLPEEEKDVCKSEYCKRTASKMLSYMNHMVDPCDDFYEYACGGFEANPQLIDGDLVLQTKNYQRIAKQMAKEKHENVHSAFTTYYDSCVHYERTVNFNERVEMAISTLNDVGKFYINATWSNNYTDFTNLFAQLMLHHSALLFDIVPKFDEYRPILQINLPKYKSPFMTEHADDLCFEDEFETEQQYVDLEALYASYKKCNKNRKEFLRSIKEALTVLSVFRGLNDSYLTWDLQSQYIEKTVQDINSVIIQGYFSHFPPKNERQEIYAMNTYTKISLKGLQSKNMLVNWTQLIYSLIEGDMMKANSILNNDLHIYLYEELMNGLSELEKFAEKDPMSLNNAIMALYAHKLYRELVLSRRNDVKDHCLQVATNLLRLEASSLYISSFPDQEIRKMDKLIQNLFNDLKQTLRNKTEQVEWTNENGRNTLLKKVNDIKLSLPDLSYYKDRDSLYSNYNMPQIMLDNDYFNNSMILLKRHRTLIYAVLRQTNRERQIWTYYATPFQSKAGVIYSLNVVMIPYGIMDWSSINEEHTLKYILLATLGNLIAHQVAHHFDNNGLYSWQSSTNVIYEDSVTDINLDDYINCHKDNLYKASMNFTLPLTEQTVSLKIPCLTLNERLSDIVGLRLAYDTLAYLTRSKAEKQLPWIKLSIEQLFYLAYTQMYCTKSPLTSSYVSLYESEDLPNRIRTFVSASTNKFVADEWNCPMGSQVAPSDVCNVFPYIDYRETAQDLV